MSMRLLTSVLLMLSLSGIGTLVFSQSPDPAAQQACTLFKRTVFEERVPISFFFANAPITYETVDSCHGSRPLIVGGSPAEAKEFPHAARLGNRNAENKTNWFCGGTLISNRLVLTAAHCFYAEYGAVNVVRLGELEFDNDKDDAEPEDFEVLSTTMHPDFNNPALYNDIGIVRLRRAVNFSLYKHPACLPFDDGERHETFIAIGWGARQFAQKQSKKLLKVQLRGYGQRCLTSVEPNEELPNGYNASTQLCIGSPESKDTCNGDSGGPVLSYHKDYPCMYHVMGITSHGIACDTPDVPSAYTRVHYYLDWIKQHLARSN
ncbi:blast:Serine protease snake [Drosophila guanche]|uniref:Blast:Serine protease snake n=1 Tax=Drosophila guanche TaxID=7266 RepID=A0A3B0KQE2_DROGU|nr:blast:Serine protease snake [Drosophila guanche]